MFIRVVPYDPFWEVEYENESQKISNILKDILVEIYHIGSTAVKGLHAKPIRVRNRHYLKQVVRLLQV